MIEFNLEAKRHEEERRAATKKKLMEAVAAMEKSKSDFSNNVWISSYTTTSSKTKVVQKINPDGTFSWYME